MRLVAHEDSDPAKFQEPLHVGCPIVVDSVRVEVPALPGEDVKGFAGHVTHPRLRARLNRRSRRSGVRESTVSRRLSIPGSVCCRTTNSLSQAVHSLLTTWRSRRCRAACSPGGESTRPPSTSTRHYVSCVPRLRSVGPCSPSANFTVLRAALAGAAQAVVVLLPSEADVRTGTALQIAHEEYKQVLNMRKEMLASDGLSEAAKAEAQGTDFLTKFENRKAEVAALLKVRELPMKLTDTDIISRAAGLAHVDGPDAALLRLAHSMDASSDLKSRPEGRVDHDDGFPVRQGDSQPSEVALDLVRVSGFRLAVRSDTEHAEPEQQV